VVLDDLEGLGVGIPEEQHRRHRRGDAEDMRVDVHAARAQLRVVARSWSLTGTITRPTSVMLVLMRT
jgi:hypothetical protein